MDLLFSSGYLDENDNLCDISIVSDNEIWVNTLIESEAEKKEKLDAENKDFIGFGSRGRVIILKKENNSWIVKEESEWIS